MTLRKKPIKAKKEDPQIIAYRECDAAIKLLEPKQKAEIIASMKSDLLREHAQELNASFNWMNGAKTEYENRKAAFEELNNILK